MINLLFFSRIGLEQQTLKQGFYAESQLHPPFNRSLFHQLDQFLYTLSSLQACKFQSIRLYIDISDTGTHQQSIKNIIEDHLQSIAFIPTYLGFHRPSSLSQWNLLFSSLLEILSPDDLVLPIFNHDHACFSPSYSQLISDSSNFFAIHPFSKSIRLFHFTHIPELLGQPKLQIDRLPVWRSNNLDFIHSTFITTLSELSFLFSSVKYAPTYMPRLDWPGVKMNSISTINSTGFTEYFYHMDRYNHTSGYCFNLSYLPGGDHYLGKDLALYTTDWADSIAIGFFSLYWYHLRDFVLSPNLFSLVFQSRAQFYKRSLYICIQSFIKYNLQYINVPAGSSSLPIVRAIYSQANSFYTKISTDRLLIDSDLLSPLRFSLSRVKNLLISQFL